MTTEAGRSTIMSGGGFDRATQLIFGLAVPLIFCALIVESRAMRLLRILQDGANTDLRGVQEILQLTLSIIFGSLMVFLFLTRKKAVAPGVSWAARLVALGGSLIAPSLVIVVGEPVPASGVMLFGSLVALFLGNALSIWALGSLGRCFGVFPAARGLVRHGPYRFVRHPLYTAEAIALFGLLLARLNPIAIALYIVSLAMQVWRTVHEERILRKVFPEYAGYQEAAGRFVPRIRRSGSVKVR